MTISVFSFAAKNQWEFAQDEAAIAAEITPEEAAKWVRLGRAQLKTSRADEAGKSFDRALALVHDAMAENNIAYYLADTGIKLDQAWQLVCPVLLNPKLGWPVNRKPCPKTTNVVPNWAA